MKNRSAKLLFLLLCIPGVLLQDFSRPVSALSAEFRTGSVTANVNLRKTPSLQGDIIAGLQKGSPVKVYGEKDGWYMISSKKNYILFKGWVYKPYVEIVSTPVAATPSGAPPPKSALVALPETPPPAPTRIPAPPESVIAPPPVAKPQVSMPAPEPGKQTATGPPAPNLAAGKSEKSAPVKRVPVSDTGAKPAGLLRLMLSISPLVLAVIALLIAVGAYRAVRTPGRRVETPEVPAETAPAKEKSVIGHGQTPVNEKRQTPRTNRLIEVDFAVAGKFYRGFITNLSETGVYLDTPATCTVGQEITISCPSIDTGGQIKRSGLIIRKTDVGYAVHFQQNETY